MTHPSELKYILLPSITKCPGRGRGVGPLMTMKKNSVWEAILRILIAAATAALTALTTTSCMGRGPLI